MTRRNDADGTLPTSPELPHAKRKALEEDDDITIISDRPPVPTNDRDFFVQVVDYMNRLDRRFVASNRRQHAMKQDLKALRHEMLVYVRSHGRIANGCLMIIAGVLVLFMLMRILGPLDLSEWRGLRVIIRLLGGTE